MSEHPPQPIPYDTARARIEANVAPLGTELRPLAEAVGRVLAQPLVAPFDVPHFDNSQVDGYAVRSGDQGLRQIVGESAAGGSAPPFVGPGDAVRIFTGAPLPDGADAIVMQEDVTVEDGRLTLLDPVRRGENVRRRGEEIAVGTRFEEFVGLPLSPPVVGLAASFGIAEVSVFRAPRVAIVATGSELILPGQPLPPGGVYASNPAALAAALKPLGSEARVQIVRDEPEETEAALRTALDDADVVLTVGGVSVGDHDLVRPTLRRLGVEEVFWRVAIKPGKPFFFGRKEQKLVFGLPGNPVSALVTFAVLVFPALSRMRGDRREFDGIQAMLGETVERRDLRYEFLRVGLNGGTAHPLIAQGSHMQTGLALADALMHIPEGLARIEAGQPVLVTPLPWRVWP